MCCRTAPAVADKRIVAVADYEPCDEPRMLQHALALARSQQRCRVIHSFPLGTFFLDFVLYNNYENNTQMWSRRCSSLPLGRQNYQLRTKRSCWPRP